MQTDILRCIIHMDACSEHARTWKFHICTLIFPDSWRGIGMLNRAAQHHFTYSSYFPPFPLLLSPPRFIFVAPANLFQGDLQDCLTVAIDHCPRADVGGCRTGYDTRFPFSRDFPFSREEGRSPGECPLRTRLCSDHAAELLLTRGTSQGHLCYLHNDWVRGRAAGCHAVSRSTAA